MGVATATFVESFKVRDWRHFDLQLLLYVVLLIGFGVVMGYSAGYNDATAAAGMSQTVKTLARIDGQVSRYSDRPSTLASAQDVLTALGPKVDQTVLSARYDIFFFGGYWPWLQVAPNYAHPHTQYIERVDYVEKMAVAASSHELAGMMTENPYGRIDALVLRDVGGRLIWAYRRNDFPKGSTRVEIKFNRQLIDDTKIFHVTQLDGYVVIRPR